MKHIFLVHSPITYLTSVAVINQLQIAKDDAVIIFVRFNKIAQPDNNYIGISLDEYYENRSTSKKIYNYVQHFNIAKRIDKLVNEATKNEKFTAYVPVLLFIGKALITHSNCYTFNFIEEGMAQYYTEETLGNLTLVNAKESWRTSIIKNTKQLLYELYMVLRGYNFKLHALPFTYSCYNSFKNVGFYGLTPESFPLADIKKKVVIPFTRETFRLDIHQNELDISNKIVWVGDAGVAVHGFSTSLYLKGINEGCIDYLKRTKRNEIFIKFHRDESLQLREMVKKLFKENGIAFQIIPDFVIMELLLLKAKYVTLIGIYSSLLYYAAIMGHTSFSIYEFVRKDYANLFANRDLNFYWRKVNLIRVQDSIPTKVILD